MVRIKHALTRKLGLFFFFLLPAVVPANARSATTLLQVEVDDFISCSGEAMALINYGITPDSETPADFAISPAPAALDAGFLAVSWSDIPDQPLIEYAIPAATPPGRYVFEIQFRALGCADSDCIFTTSFVIYIDPEPSLVCKGQVNVNLRDNCQIALQAASITSGFLGCADWSDFSVQVNDLDVSNGGVVDQCGRYVYEVSGPDNFFCWGYVEAEDKQPPLIGCPGAVTGYDDGDGFREFVCEDLSNLLLQDTWQYTTDGNGNITEIPDELAAVLNITGYPVVTDNCGDLLVSVKDEWQPTEEDCMAQVIYRYFTVTDHCMQLTAECVQEIHIGIPTLEHILLPKEDQVIDCGEDILLDANGHPHPDVTGYPVLRTALGEYVLDQSVCNLGAAYVDSEPIDLCGNTYKIVRHWQLLDWCNPEDAIEFNQLIKIADEEAPLVLCPTVDYDKDGEPDPLTFSTGPFDCTAAFEVPMPQVEENCSDWTVLSEVLIGNENGPVAASITHGQSRYVSGIPLGCHTFRYTVVDACGNQTVIYCPFRIEDQVAPIAVCNDDLHISVGDQGYARVSAEDVGEGSSDNCGDIRIEVRRRILDISSYACLEAFDVDGNGVILNDEVRLGFENGDTEGDGVDFAYYTEWGPYVEFTCCDIGAEVRIELRVWDDRNGSGFAGDNSEVEDCINYAISIQSDNHNTCWLDVLVEDKISPDCIPPLPARVNCDELPYDFDPANAVQMTALFGLAEGYDNCPDFTVEELAPDTENLDDCHSGTFIRYFQVTDGQGIESERCEQLVTILPVRDYWIKFPADAAANCGVPEIDTIMVSEGTCDLLAVSIKEETFSASGDECYKLFRTYSVINWCEYDGEADPVVVSRDEDCDGLPGDEAIWVIVRTMHEEDPCPEEYGAAQKPYYSHVWYDQDGDPFNLNPAAGTKGKDCDYTTNPTGFWKEIFPLTENEDEDTDYYPLGANGDHCADMASVGFWQYTQVIKVYDSTEPVIHFNEQFPFCSYSSDLDAGCPAEVEITFTLEEYCTPDDLSISVQLDAFRDGLMDEDLSAAIIGTYPHFTIKGAVPIGEHYIQVRVEDGCGNQAERLIPFEVVDCKAPAPICINGLAVELMPVVPSADVDGDGQEDVAAMTIWASDFIASPAVDCSGEVTYSINLKGRPSNADQTSLVLTCGSDLNTLVEIWAWDGTGYGDFCATYVFVQDNMVQCPSGAGAVTGVVATEQDKPVESVSISLNGGSALDSQTDLDGHYRFGGLPAGFDYTITPSRTDAPLNGVSTYDLIVLSRHILGVELLGSPYQLIAADINNDGRITAIDAIALRRVILNIDANFTSNTSWRFLPKSYTFPVPENPWSAPFPEVININALSEALDAQDFIAVKLGDLNGSVQANALEVKPRTVNGRYAFRVESMMLEAGNEYLINFRADPGQPLLGFQGTITLDPAQVAVQDVLPGIIGRQHLGLRFLDQGLITTSWHRDGTESRVAGDVVFSIKISARKNTRLEQALQMSSRLTAAEAYAENGDLLDLELDFGDVAQRRGPELYQNHPNPFREATTIGFFLPAPAAVDLQIHDASGRLLKLIRNNFTAGQQTVVLRRDEIGASGVLYYTLVCEHFTATRKMIVLADN